eukprot:768692-Hanusia_phi.AAC.2
MNQFSRRVCVLLVAWLTATITTGHELKHQASEHVKIKSAVLTGKEKRSVRHDVRRTLNLRLRGGSLHQTVRQGLQFAKRVPSALQDDIDYTEGKKYIFIMSDFTGFTASHILTAVLYQFPSCSHSNSVTTQVFSNVKSVLKMRRIIAFAKYVGALVCFTIRDTELRKELADECKEANIAAVDLLGDLSDGLSHFLELTPIKDSADQVDSTLQRKPLSSGYFKRIEAVDFAIKMDEGSFPENYHKADLVLVGVSRVQKTPLAMYLSQQFGLKVANTKIVLDCPAEPELLKIDPKKVFALTCQADWLLKMRRRRVMMVRSDFQDDSLRKGSIKFEVGPGHSETEYASMDYIRTELEYADSIFRQNPQWNRIDITGLSVEEVADLHIVPALPRRPTVIEVAAARSDPAGGDRELPGSAGGSVLQLLHRARRHQRDRQVRGRRIASDSRSMVGERRTRRSLRSRSRSDEQPEHDAGWRDALLSIRSPAPWQVEPRTRLSRIPSQGSRTRWTCLALCFRVTCTCRLAKAVGRLGGAVYS